MCKPSISLLRLACMHLHCYIVIISTVYWKNMFFSIFILAISRDLSCSSYIMQESHSKCKEYHFSIICPTLSRFWSMFETRSTLLMYLLSFRMSIAIVPLPVASMKSPLPILTFILTLLSLHKIFSFYVMWLLQPLSRYQISFLSFEVAWQT